MCGLAVIINKNKKVRTAQIKKMCDLIQHRGPDDEGYVYINDEIIRLYGDETSDLVKSQTTENASAKDIEKVKEENARILLGHRRLSILDLSVLGHQPMSYDNGRFWIVFNGEIYNYIEIRTELLNLGHKFISHTDTEVILASYMEWGEKCLDKFNGMWAFVIYDSFSDDIFLSRDRYGIKPLYYYISKDNNLCLASEIKQFTILDGWEAKLNHQRAYDYLIYSLTDHTEETMFSGVHQILPGHFYNFKVEHSNFKYLDKIDQKKWYNTIYKPYTKYTFAKACDKFNELFKNSIRFHLRSDVEVGSALSGGLDSSSIVCEIYNILKEENKTELQKTFSSCSLDARYDEKKWMDIVVDATNVNASFVYPNGEDVFKLTNKVLWHQDEPYQSQSAFLGFHVFEIAAKKGVKVLLNGQGADEYLSGYGEFDRYRKYLLLKNMKFSKLKNEFETDNFTFAIFHSMKLLYFVHPKLFHRVATFFNKNHRETELLFNTSKLKVKRRYPYSSFDEKKLSVASISKRQMLFEPLPKYLRWEDRNSMAHSVEARVPFLDYRLVEFCNQLPVEYLDSKIEKKKILLHGLSDILPGKILDRKDKKGFITPEERWVKEDFTNEFRNEILSAIENSKGIINKYALSYYDKMTRGEINFDYTYWRIILFSKWMKLFKIEL